MKIAKTYTFYTFLILSLATILMGTVWFSKKAEEQRHVLHEQNAVFERYKAVLKLESNLIRKTVFDYSFWDELVEFVETVDTTWSKENLETIISTFDVDYVYVFNKEKKLIYAYHPHDEKPLLPDIKALSTTQPQFKEFFQEDKGVFNQFFVAPIHYSADLERKGEPLGFFLLGREWGSQFHKNMEEISLGKATLSSLTKSDFYFPLKDLNDSVLGYLSFEFTPSVLLFMGSLQNSVLISGLIVMVTVICMFYLLTKDTFLTPIERISHALKTHKPFYLVTLSQKKNELGEIATLILEYEKQKQLLEHYKEAIDENTIVSKTDAKGIITYINDQFLTISGYERDELLGKPHNIVRHPDNSPEFFQEMWKELKGGKTWKGIVKNRRKDGSAYYVKSVIMPLFDSHQRIKEYIAIRYDVSELFEHVERLRKETLAELPNRKMLLEEITNALTPHLAIVNISGFREINTLYGQSFGDSYLQSCATTLQNHLEKNIRLFHLQADEFALFCDDATTTQELFVEQCKTLLKTLSFTGVSVENKLYTLALRMGIANGVEYLYNRAEIAIKEARTTHNAIVIYDDNEGFKQRLQQDIKWDQTIRDALAHNRFTLFLQEIVPLHVKKNDRKKYELLIRLIDAKGAIISPFHFIDLAKRLHLYAHITQFVLQEGFRLAHELVCDISINITKEDMLCTETSTLLFELLTQYPELKKRITLELVESESLEDSTDVRTFLQNAREKGCLIAIDDFGSGYSNFEYLLRLHVDFIKIDGSLIKNIDTDANAYTTVKAITHFAKNLGISVVAEFVHSEEVLVKVRELGIDYAQGFHLHKPTDMATMALPVKR